MNKLPFDKDGIIISIVLYLVAIHLGIYSTNLGWISFLLATACLLFFRDPDRIVPKDTSNLVISPADGIILKICECDAPEELELQEKVIRISIFMNIFNVHVNRSPVNGIIKKMLYVPGRFVNVTLDKASEFNERQIYTVDTKHGEVTFVQIAGLIARRIRADVQEGETIKAGQKIGIIRFGSRLEVYLPTSVKVFAEEGQITIAGETVLAKFS